MGSEVNSALDQSFDFLETAFSDTTRKLIREINAEWLTVQKYKSDLSAKEDELQAAKEKLMHFNEVNYQNERYLESTKNRIIHLKQSNVELKNKLTNLKREEEKLAKQCAEEAEYMKAKLSFYEDKWRKRYEIHYTKNPKLREKQTALKELSKVTAEFNSIKLEYEKCEKDLFQAKCERNRRTVEESKIYPLDIFIITIASIYVETKNTYKEVSELVNSSNTISCNKLKDHIELLTDKRIEEENLVIETNFKPSAGSYYEPTNNNSCNSTVQMNDEFDERTHQIQMRTNYHEMKTLQANKEQESSASNKYFNRQSRAQKWMEKLKIFVPNFSALSAAVSETSCDKIMEDISSDLPQRFEDLGREHTTMPNEISRDVRARNNDGFPREEIPTVLSKGNIKNSSVSSSFAHDVRNEETGKMSTSENYSEKNFNTNFSKYFKSYDSNSSVDILNESRTNGETTTSESFANTMEITDNGDMIVDVEAVSDIQDSTNKSKQKNNIIIPYTKMQDENISHETFVRYETNSAVSPSKAKGTVCSSDRSHNSEVNDNSKFHHIEEQTTKTSNEIDIGENRNETEMQVNNLSTSITSFTKENEQAIRHSSDFQTSSSHHVQSSSFLCESNSEQKSENSYVSINSEIRDQGARFETRAGYNPSQNDRLPNNELQTQCPSMSSSEMFKNDESDDKIMSKKSSQNSTGNVSDAGVSNLPSFSADSPGFVYTTRLMYEKNIVANRHGNYSDQQYNNAFMPMNFFNNNPGNNPNLSLTQSEKDEDENNGFLASAYENYLDDSPPAMAAGTEKSMFSFTEDSPDTGTPNNDFFPLFAANNEEDCNKNKMDNAGNQFVLNFGSSSKSPNTSPDFKFLF